jgi:hypothetical protein
MKLQGPETEDIMKRTSSGAGRRGFAAVALTGALLACAPAKAQSAADVAGRIEAALNLVEAFEESGAVTRLPLQAFAPWTAPDPATLLAFHAPRESIASATEIVLARLPKPRPDAPLAAPIVTPIVTGSIAPQADAAPESDFFSRFAGTFSGSGEVKRNAGDNASQVRCTLTGRPSASGVTMSGECGAFIFSKDIRADISYDAASGLYTGTYVGSSIGPAKLRGERRGDAVVLTITWPKPVNGDTKATMTIRNSGNGTLAIIVTDDARAGGPTTEVTRLALDQI